MKLNWKYLAAGTLVVCALSAAVIARPQVTAKMSSSQLMPIVPPNALGDGTYVGEIRSFATEVPPSGWRECNGSSLDIATHQQLFNVIGTRFGSTGPTSFQIPDLRGTFARGWNHGKNASNSSGTIPLYDSDASARSLPGGAPAYPDGTDHVGTYELGEVQNPQNNFVVTPPQSGPGVLLFPNEVATGASAYRFQSNQGGNNWYSRMTNMSGSGPETHPTNVDVIFAIRDPNQ